MSAGVFLMRRGWMDDALFRGQKFSRAQAWIWMIESAAWGDHRIEVGGQFVPIERGQFSHSFRFMAQAWRWPEANVRRYVRRLQSDARIDAAIVAGQILITVRDYDSLQSFTNLVPSLTDAATDATVTQQRRSSDANKNSINSVNRYTAPSALVLTPPENKRPRKRTAPPEHPRFKDFWAAKPTRGGATDDRKRAATLFARLVDSGVDPEEIIRGALGYAAWATTDGCAGTKYIQQGTTFLNSEAWKQYATTAAAPAAESPSKTAYRSAFKDWDASGRKGAVPTLDQFAHLDSASQVAA